MRRGWHLCTTKAPQRQRLWPDGTFVDFDNNLNSAVTRVRQALGDSAESPRYIETLPRLGYRFLAPVERSPAVQPTSVGDSPPAPAEAASPPASRPTLGPRWRAVLAAIVLGAVVAATTAWRVLGGGDAAPGAVMLAVLPFENLSGDPADDYMSAGLTEEMITELARVAPDHLSVIARTSVLKYRGGVKNVHAIARELRADYVLEGSIRRNGQRVRVTAQLIEAERQSHVWADSFDRELSDLLALEREIARAVASSVHLAVAPQRAPPPAAVPADARDAYLRGRYFASQATPFATERAIEHYTRAVAFAPGYALARAELARVLIFATRTEPGVALARAREEVVRALELDPGLPEAHLVWAMVLLYRDRDLAAAGEAFERAIALDPGSAEARFAFSQYLTASGRFDAALDAARRALELDPFSPLVHHYIGRILHFAGRDREAIEHLHGTLELTPNYTWALLFLAVAHESLGELDEAVSARQRYWTAMGVPPDRVARLGEVYAVSGYSGVRRAWKAWIEGFARELGFVTSSELALLYAAEGDHDRAFEWLGRAYESRTRDLIYLDVYPQLAPLRGDPRFQQLRSLVFPARH
jgi:TolB-like protein/Flp pilus assembly protein TadD